ncbi:MAG: fimbrial protein, partial [Rikenellaceae bacterium]
MKRLKYLSIVACMALLIASCNKQTSTESNTIGEGVAKITLRLSDAATYAATEPGVDDENHIKELKIFIFDQASKAFERVIKIDPKQSAVGNDMWDNTSNTLVMRDFPEPTRLRTVYVIANWAISDVELAKITTEQLLVASLTELTGAIAVPTKELPLLMSGKAESHNFSTEKSLTVDVKRQVVKIELTVSIDANFLAAFPKYIFGEAKVQLHNAPKSSYVCEQQSPALPAGNVMFKYDAQTMIASGATQVATLYVYENPAMGVNAPLATFFTLQLPYTNNGVTTDKNYYKLTINNSGDASNPSRTLRNTFYKMNVRVLGFGTEVPNQNSVDITTNVLPWDGEDILSDDGKMLTLSAASVDLDEADEQIIVDYKGGKLNSAQLSGDAASHIDLTISEIDDNSGTITLKRKDELHRGLKYIGKLTV